MSCGVASGDGCLSADQPRWTRAIGRAQLKGAPLIYIHAKVSIVADHSAIVSSANLNGRSLRWDTEAGVVLTDPETVQGQRLMAHWLPEGAGSAQCEFADAKAAQVPSAQ